MLRRTALVTILLGLAATPAPGAPPQVDKLEPPSWWTGSAWTPIRLLAHGRGLGQAQLSAQAPLSAGNLKFSERGTYLFADLTIPPEAAPGKYRLRFAFAGGGAQEVEFELLSMPDRSEQAQGFSPADFIYLIMPDRFANGDPSNDDPAVSRGLWDRGNPRYYHGGDLQGVIDHATYLRNLGVTAAWLNPWYDNNNRLNEKERYGGQPMADYHGYGAVDYYAVEEHFGTLPLLQKMVTSLQAEGIKVIQDQVANHVGPYHPWSADPPTPAWFNGTPARHTANTLADVDADGPLRQPGDAPRDAGGVVHRHPARPEPERTGGAALPDPEQPVVGRRDGHRCDPPGHHAVRPARFLARLDGGAEEGLPAA